MAGVETFTFFAAVYCISQRSPDYRKRQRFYMAYGAVLLFLFTIQFISEALWGQYMWIDHRNYPGGPLAFYAASQAAWYVVIGLVATAVVNILGDGLLVYRCFIIWDSRWRVIALPALIYLASCVLAVVTVVESTLPGTPLLKGNSALLSISWYSLSVGLNAIVTSMICFRILRMRALTREVLTPELSSMYTGVATMLIESAVPFSILGICLIITVVQDAPPKFAFAYVWSIFCSLSPQMIILRVSMGCAWLKETANELNTALEFAQPTDSSVPEHSQWDCATICDAEDPTSRPRTPANGSDTSNMIGVGAASVSFV